MPLGGLIRIGRGRGFPPNALQDCHRAIHEFAHLGGADVFCGPTIHDRYRPVRSIVWDLRFVWGPDRFPRLCTTPALFLYVLGTIDVKYE